MVGPLDSKPLICPISSQSSAGKHEPASAEVSSVLPVNIQDVFTSASEPTDVSLSGQSFIKGFEGYRSKAYQCSAHKWTIGFGSTKVDGHKVHEGDTITPDKAGEVFANDLEKYDTLINNSVKVSLTQGQHDALVSFAYNVGPKAFQDSTLLKLLNNGDKAGAAKEFDKWVKAGGKVIPGLVRRREGEKSVFLLSQETNNETSNPFT